jgi:hypothetical protein
MRKVLFQKWVGGVELESTKGKSVQPWDRDYKDGTNCWTDFINEGFFHEFVHNFGLHGETVGLIEENGELVYVNTTNFKFSDSVEPDREQRKFEAAVAAMQGMLSDSTMLADTPNSKNKMIQHKINEVFIDSENFTPAKRLKCVEDIAISCKCEGECIFYNIPCHDIMCTSFYRGTKDSVYFIETTEPLSEQP